MDCSYKTLILELNVLSNQGLLQGETPEQRYQYFENLLHDKKYLRQLANEYPVLIRSLLRITEKWTAHVSEVLDRFKADYPKIVSHMPEVNQFGKLVQLHIGAGDTHDGRSVTILEFTTGGKLVYKPRSLRVDKEYYKILSWMQHCGVPHTKIIKNLDCGSYGWTEFVEHSECNSTEEISEFYKNMGVNLAIMYMFNATDFHYENIIAHGSSPVVIDLESLFHRHISTKKFEHNASGHAYEIISQSVMSSGMLPQYIFKSDTYSGIDISGIFGYGGKKYQMY